MSIDTTGVLAIRSTSKHNACMTKSITIRNVPDGTCRELASRAASNGHSLQSYLRTALIDLADRPGCRRSRGADQRTQGVDRHETVGRIHSPLPGR